MNFSGGFLLVTVGIIAGTFLVSTSPVNGAGTGAGSGPRLKDAKNIVAAYKKLVNGGKNEGQKCEFTPLSLMYQLGFYAGKTPEAIVKAYKNHTSSEFNPVPNTEYELKLEAKKLRKYIKKARRMCSMKKELFCDEKELKCKKCTIVSDVKCRVLRDIKNSNSSNGIIVSSAKLIVIILGFLIVPILT